MERAPRLNQSELGLPPGELERHIAWDIGAADLARRLSARLDAPLFLSGASRLLIDLNRPLWGPTSIPATSEATAIPGNQDLDPDRLREAFGLFPSGVVAVAAEVDGMGAKFASGALKIAPTPEDAKGGR